MANIFKQEARNVVPGWRSFNNTLDLGELSSPKEQQFVPERQNIDEYIFDFKQNYSVAHASELISAAVSNNQLEVNEVHDAAKFILDRGDETTKAQARLAEKIYKKEPIYRHPIRSVILPISQFNIDDYRKQIKHLKEAIRYYPYNAILYVELSRCYSTLGEENKAIQAMKTALHLAPNNRFVLRSASRLFAHFHTEEKDYLSYIHFYLKKHAKLTTDPWILSAEISISTVLEKSSRFIKKGIEIINSNNFSPYSFTELASSLGTVEILNGSNKKGKKYFHKALISPNDNTLAQAEWATHEKIVLDIDQSNYSNKANFEAMALDLYHNEKFEDTLDYTRKWFMDQPFSRRPVLFGSSLISSLSENKEKTQDLLELLKAGLISHPGDPTLINNLAYALSLNGEADQALNYIQEHKYHKMDRSTKICFKATEGLAQMRLGNLEVGRSLYREAIMESKDADEKTLNWKAILNFAREEIKIGTKGIEGLMDAVEKIPGQEPEIKRLRKETIDSYKKQKSIDEGLTRAIEGIKGTMQP